MRCASRITGTGSAFPDARISNHELVRRLSQLKVDTSDRWILERTGISERRYANLTKESEQNSSLAAAAAQAALEMAGKTPSDIDQIIVATCTPESLIPSTACWVQAKLGAHKAWATDINAACTGFVYGLAIADRFIQAGDTYTALVIGSEVLHPFLNWKDRASCILFGDGAGAAVVESVPEGSERRILAHYLHSDGRLGKLLYIPAYDTSWDHAFVLEENGTSRKMVMNGREIFKAAVRTLTECAHRTMEKSGIALNAVDWFIPHQANHRILEAVASRLAIPPEKVLINVDKYGNTSAATIPTIIDEAVRDGRIQQGQLLLLDAFGAGLTHGAMLIRW
jgi:3-oxoacyl-[acyl-carrier-protein] synthase III